MEQQGFPEGHPHGLPQAGSRSPEPRAACCFSAHHHQPVSTCLGLAPHPCVGEPQVPAGHVDTRADTQGLAVPSFPCDCFLGKSLCPGAVHPMAAWPPLTPHHSLTRQEHNMACEVVRSHHSLDDMGRECWVIQDFPGNQEVWLSFSFFIFFVETVGLVSASGVPYRRFFWEW